MNTLPRVVWVTIVAALLILGQQAEAATKIALLYTPAVDFAGCYVAKDRGFFAERGLDVELSLAQNGAVIAPALVSNSAQIGTPTLAVLLQADEQGLGLVVVAGGTVAPTPPGATGVVAREGSGLKGAADLVGRKVGVPSFGGTLDVLAKNWVRASGADYRKVDWVEVPFPRMGDSLKAGLVDAVQAVAPFYRRIIDEKLGYSIGDPNADVPRGTLVVEYSATRAWVAKNAGAIRGFRAALVEATAYIADPAHADTVRASIANYTKLPPEAAQTVEIPDNLQPQVKPDGFTFWIKAMRDQGLIKGNPDPASLIAP